MGMGDWVRGRGVLSTKLADSCTIPGRFAEDFRHLAENGMMGTDFDSCCQHWATEGLNYYVVAPRGRAVLRGMREYLNMMEAVHSPRALWKRRA